jgi:acetyl-CoA carboxylase carboxyltransferase component
MGPEPAINAVYFNKMAEMKPEEKAAFLKEKTAEYQKEINILRIAGELIVDAMIDFSQIRDELVKRLRFYERPKEPMSAPGIMPM